MAIHTMLKIENPDRSKVSVYTISLAALFLSSAAVLFVPAFDRAVIQALNLFTRRSFLFDAACHAVSDSTMFSGMIFVALLWYCWFFAPDLYSRHKTFTGTIASAVASLFSRATQLSFPSRARPFQDPALHLKLPYTVKLDSLRHVASSYPSDHAALYFALAATIFSVNRKAGYYAVGLAALLDVIRLYLGFHYFSDIVGGAALGVLCVYVLQHVKAGSIMKRFSTMYQAPSPAFYALAFCATYFIATMFSDIRLLAAQVAHLVRH
jgi:membrane-associated phospholipid phosphatase